MKKVRHPDEGGEIENLVGPVGMPTNVSKIGGRYSRFRPRAIVAGRTAMYDDVRSRNAGVLVRKVKRV